MFVHLYAVRGLNLASIRVVLLVELNFIFTITLYSAHQWAILNVIGLLCIEPCGDSTSLRSLLVVVVLPTTVGSLGQPLVVSIWVLSVCRVRCGANIQLTTSRSD